MKPFCLLLVSCVCVAVASATGFYSPVYSNYGAAPGAGGLGAAPAAGGLGAAPAAGGLGTAGLFSSVLFLLFLFCWETGLYGKSNNANNAGGITIVINNGSSNGGGNVTPAPTTAPTTGGGNVPPGPPGPIRFTFPSRR